MKYSFLLLLACVPLFLGCGASFQMVSLKNMSETEALKAECDRLTISSPEIAAADSLMSEAKTAMAEGKHKVAFDASRIASVYYRLVLARREYEHTQKLVDSAERKLSENLSRLNTYESVLTQMKTQEVAQ